MDILIDKFIRKYITIEDDYDVEILDDIVFDIPKIFNTNYTFGDWYSFNIDNGCDVRIANDFYGRHNGRVIWTKRGECHRGFDKPAKYDDNIKEWWWYGSKHREDDKPAVEHSNGAKEWYHKGKRHREDDKPAMISATGDQYWYENDFLHRVGGPAVILGAAGGGKQGWYRHGKEFWK